jgi:hypothetical protein
VRKHKKRPGEPGAKPGERALLVEREPKTYNTGVAPPTPDEDPELWTVYEEFHRVPGAIDLLGEAIRDSFDQIYDGQHTGRWDYRQLNKTEKTHIGTLVQINVHRYLTLADGEDLDYRIAGVDVDAKWSRMVGEWEIPEEMYLKNGPQVALVIWGNDYTARWAAGLVRTEEQYLRPKGNQRDKKRKLNEAGNDRILWLRRDGELQPNQLLRALTAEQRQTVLGQRSGQACVNALFNELQGVLVNRASVLTAAMQADSPKRVRDARERLKSKGIVILGHYAPHPEIARTWGLPEPVLGSYVSARVAPAHEHEADSVMLEGMRWRIARRDDPEVEAPALPSQGRVKDPDPAPLHLG